MPDKPPAAPGLVLSRSQLIFNLLYSLVPLIGFWLVEKYWGLEAGIVVAIVLGIGEVAWVYWRERRWEPFSLWSAVLVIVMGIVSWQLESGKILLLKPAIIEAVFASVFIVSSIAKKPFMLLMAQKQFGKVEFNSMQLRYFNGVNWRIGLLFLLHTMMTVYAALWLSSDAWFFAKGVLFYILLALFFLGEFVYARFIVRPRMQREIENQRAFLTYQRELIERMRRGEHKN
jgi:intracellular septation protein A